MEIRIAGLFLLTAGWVIMLAAAILLPSPSTQSVFEGAGFLVEVLGFVFVGRSHTPRRKKRHA